MSVLQWMIVPRMPQASNPANRAGWGAGGTSRHMKVVNSSLESLHRIRVRNSLEAKLCSQKRSFVERDTAISNYRMQQARRTIIEVLLFLLFLLYLLFLFLLFLFFVLLLLLILFLGFFVFVILLVIIFCSSCYLLLFIFVLFLLFLCSLSSCSSFRFSVTCIGHPIFLFLL